MDEEAVARREGVVESAGAQEERARHGVLGAEGPAPHEAGTAERKREGGVFRHRPLVVGQRRIPL